MMSAKLFTLSLLEIKVFRNKGYDVITPDYEVIKIILSRESKHIVDVVL